MLMTRFDVFLVAWSSLNIHDGNIAVLAADSPERHWWLDAQREGCRRVDRLRCILWREDGGGKPGRDPSERGGSEERLQSTVIQSEGEEKWRVCMIDAPTDVLRSRGIINVQERRIVMFSQVRVLTRAWKWVILGNIKRKMDCWRAREEKCVTGKPGKSSDIWENMRSW